MSAAGHFLLWSGFMAAAFASVCRLEQVDDKWSTIPWLWYCLSVGVGIGGVVLLRKARDEESKDESKTQAEYSIVRESLDALISIVNELRSAEAVPADILQAIDERCADRFSDFAEARQSLVKRFGLQVYAEVMTEFASGERYVNRAWSASADGYVEEISASLAQASAHLAKAQAMLAAAEALSESG